MLKAHVNKFSACKGFAWIIYNATLVFTHECKEIHCKQDERSNKINLH